MTASATVMTSPMRRPDGIGLGLAASVLAIRTALWPALQLLVALLAGGFSASAINIAAGWWMVYGSVVDVLSLATLAYFLRGAGIAFRSLLGPPAAVWQVVLGGVGVLVASIPAIVFSAELTPAMYGTGAIPPMLEIIDVPSAASGFSVVVWPVILELSEPVIYLGVLLPALERRIGNRWIASAAVLAVWALEHALFPILVTGGTVDQTFALYRVTSSLPLVAIWIALFHAYGRRVLPIMAGRYVLNAGTAAAVALGAV